MAISIYDKFLSVSNINYFTKLLAEKLNLNTFTYYYDKQTFTQIPNTKDIKDWNLSNYPQWRRTFNLCDSAKIKSIGLENYVLENHRLNFYLTIKGYNILYVVDFYSAKKEIHINDNEENNINPSQNNKLSNEEINSLFIPLKDIEDLLYSEDEDGQLSFVFDNI